MIRNKTEERKRRLSTKTLDSAFRKEMEEGLNCSPIESEALLDIVIFQECKQSYNIRILPISAAKQKGS